MALVSALLAAQRCNILPEGILTGEARWRGPLCCYCVIIILDGRFQRLMSTTVPDGPFSVFGDSTAGNIGMANFLTVDMVTFHGF